MTTRNRREDRADTAGPSACPPRPFGPNEPGTTPNSTGGRPDALDFALLAVVVILAVHIIATNSVPFDGRHALALIAASALAGRHHLTRSTR